jgi:AraC-like DNA-binding protein
MIWQRQMRVHGLSTALEVCDSVAPTIQFQFDNPKSGTCRLDVQLSQIDCMRTTCVSHSLAMSGYVKADGRELTMVFVESGSAAAQRGGSEFAHARTGDCIIVNPRVGDTFQVSANNVRRVVALPNHGIDSVIVRHFHIMPPKSIAFTRLLHRHHATLAVLRDLARDSLVSASGAEGPFAAALAKQYADLMVTSLLLNVPNSLTETLAKAGRAAETRYVRRALEFMQVSLNKPIDIDEIAAQADCSPRRLQMAFRSVYGISPMNMLKKMRLELAEQSLRSGECTNVAALARSLGFGNPGRFAAEFRQRFGCCLPRSWRPM